MIWFILRGQLGWKYLYLIPDKGLLRSKREFLQNLSHFYFKILWFVTNPSSAIVFPFSFPTKYLLYSRLTTLSNGNEIGRRSFSSRTSNTNQQGTKWAGKAYMPKNAYMGANMAVFGLNILIILRGSKSFGAYTSENHLGTSFALFFWSGMAPNVPERPIFGLKCIFWVKMGRFLAKLPNFWGIELKCWYPHSRKPHRHLVRIVFWLGMGPNGPIRPIFVL